MRNRAVIRRHAYCIAEMLERKWLLSGTYPLTAIPALNSDPGAPATLYLDFHGEPAQTIGFTPVTATPAYDIDGDPTTFSSQELANIQEIWARVSEIYSPFNLNVTTVDPGNWGNGGQHQLRVLIGGTGDWVGGGYAGIAEEGGFADSWLTDTVFSFSANMGGNPTEVAEDASHEAGHGFGLFHQSVYSGTTLVSEYNTGNSLVGPIMGVPFSSQRALWWDGPDDLGYNVIQDDMSVIAGSANGFGYRSLTVGQSSGAATPLSISSGSISGSGIIESTSQTDYYSFTTGAGTDTFNMNVAQYGPTLHAKLQLFDANGNLVATAANANTLGQTLTANLAAGNYYLVAESYGQYGDVGQYTLSGAVASGGSSTPTFAISGLGSVNEQAAYALNLSASDPGQTISSWSINWGDGNTQTVMGNPSSVSHTYATGPNSYTIHASASDGNGTYSAGNTVGVSVLHVPPSVAISGAASVNEGSLYTLNLAASDLHTILSWTLNWGDGNTQTVTGNPSSATHIYATGPNSYTIQASVTDNVGTYSASSTVSVSVAHVTPSVAISGAASVNEGSLYTLSLAASDLHTILSWSLNWGDGNTQTVSGNPSSVTHIYAAGPNLYTVQASETDNVGTYATSSTVAVSVAHVTPSVAISGAASVNEGSIYTLGLAGSDLHAILTWSVNWGDGNTQTVNGNPSSVTHTYAAGPNSYTIHASATDNVGTYAAGNTVAVSVLHVTPSFSLSGAASINEGSAYTLGLSASDLHAVASWSINWGDGSGVQSVTGNPSSVTHTYATGPNSYTISASAIDNTGTYAAGNSIPVSVLHVPPVLSLSGAASINEGSVYTLSLSGSDLHTILSWSINWGDGTSVQTVSGNPSSVTHTYLSAPLTPTISATATDNVNTYSAGNTVHPTIGVVPVSIGLSGAGSVNQGSPFSLTLGSVVDIGATPSGYVIHWGDGSSASVGAAGTYTHTFDAAGTKNVSVDVTDPNGTHASAGTLSVGVVAVPFTVNISGAAGTSQGDTYTLALSASEPLDQAVSQWTINWGDGSGAQALSGNPSSASHVFTATGSFVISATAVNGQGSATANTVGVHVLSGPAFSISGASTVLAGSVYALSLSASDPAHTVTGWSINWGDGNVQAITGSPASVTHTYTVAATADLISATATDDSGTSYPSVDMQVVAVTVPTPVDTTPPTATASLPSLIAIGALSGSSSANQSTYTFQVVYSDNVAINVSTLGNNNIAVTGPNGYSQAATLVSIDVDSNGAVRTATYSITSPDSAWSSADNGTYTAVLQANSVTDTSGNAAAATTLGSFQVAVLTTTPPTAAALLSDLTAANQSTYAFQVVYSDNVAINVSTLGNDNVVVTGPNGYSQTATLVSVDASSSSATRTATYSITPPDGAWSSADDGTYTAALQANSVTDTSGTAAAATSLGSFQVVVPPSMGTVSGTGHATNTGTLTGGDQTLRSLTLTQPEVVTFALTAQRTGITVQVTDSSGNVVLTRSARTFSAAVTLALGTYNVNVSFTGTLANKYTLTATAKPVAARVSATASAAPGTQNNYWVTLTQPQIVTLALTAKPGVTVQVIDMSGNVLFNQSGLKLSSKFTLAAGSYSIQVSNAGQTVSRYTLSTTNAAITAARLAALRLAAAKNA
jgi:hypothetical protein